MKRIPVYKLTCLMIYILAIFSCIIIMPDMKRNTLIIYILTLTIGLFCITLADLSKSESVYWIYMILGVLIVGSLMAFRAQTAKDDPTYRLVFSWATGKNLLEYINCVKFEKGYQVLQYYLHIITNGNYNWAQVITTYLCFMLWGIGLKKYRSVCSGPVLMLIMWTQYYCLIMHAGLVRMFIAISIVFLSIGYLWEGKYKKYILLIFIASLFHMSALIMLLLLPFAFKPDWFFKNWKKYLISLCILIPIAFFGISIIARIMPARYSQYAVLGSLNISIGDFDVLPIWIAALYYYKKADKKDSNRYIVYLVLTTMTIIFSVCSSIVPLGRVTLYTNISKILLISDVAKHKPVGRWGTIILILMVCYSFVYVMYSGFSAYNNLYPYISFL